MELRLSHSSHLLHIANHYRCDKYVTDKPTTIITFQMSPRFKPLFLTTMILVIILCQLVVGLPVSEKQIDEPSTETQLVFEIPEQNSTNLTVNGQSDNGLPDETLDGIRFDEILDWINDKLNKAYDKSKKLYEITAEFVSDYYKPIIIIIVACLALYFFPYVFLIIIRMVGYTAGGIVVGSKAAFHMSLYGGQVASGSLVSLLQSAGVLGIGGLRGAFTLLFRVVGASIRFIFS